MSIYGYTHEKIASMEKYISEHDMKALILEQLATIHGMLCVANEHVEITVGSNKGKCKYCLKTIEKLIDHGLEPGP